MLHFSVALYGLATSVAQKRWKQFFLERGHNEILNTTIPYTKTMAASAASTATTTSSLQRVVHYVACNVYVSAGGGDKRHAALLLQLLRQAQQQSRGRPVGVVHAYADQVYNRSSFHLVGQAEPLAVVAGDLACQAVIGLRELAEAHDKTQPQQNNHPNVGFVDHVSVMPIQGRDKNNNENNDDDGNSNVDFTNSSDHDFVPATPSGIAARHIGKVLQQAGVHVCYYGSAHQDGKTLATVRREETHFFSSGGLMDHSAASNGTQAGEVATVGAPLGFVENYNIRLKATCPKRVAQSLTKRVRERDGGLVGVEALTLPYANGQWEVACNLLCPKQTSAHDIDQVVADWTNQIGQDYVEIAYRVGTTAEQCLEAITTFNSVKWEQHNNRVEDRLQSYLLSFLAQKN